MYQGYLYWERFIMDKEIIIKEEDLPKKYLIGQFGCLDCEWKYTYCERFDSEKVIFTFHPDMICQKRKDWLLNLIPPYPLGKKPTMSQLRLDINKSLGDRRQRQILHYIQILDKEIAKLKQDPDENASTLRLKEDQLRKFHNDWNLTWKELCKLDEQQLNRETPKEINITHQNPMDRLREVIIDAKVIKDDKETNN